MTLRWRKGNFLYFYLFSLTPPITTIFPNKHNHIYQPPCKVLPPIYQIRLHPPSLPLHSTSRQGKGVLNKMWLENYYSRIFTCLKIRVRHRWSISPAELVAPTCIITNSYSNPGWSNILTSIHQSVHKTILPCWVNRDQITTQANALLSIKWFYKGQIEQSFLYLQASLSV